MINGLYIMIVLGLSITCIGLMIQSTLFQWMNVSKELLPGALSYDNIIFIGALFSALYNYESALLRAYGDSVTPLLFLILSAILNIVFDFSFRHIRSCTCYGYCTIDLLFIMLFLYEKKIRFIFF